MTMAPFHAAYTAPDAAVERALAEGRRPIRTLGFDAPHAMLVSAGFQPVRLVGPRLGSTPRADAIMGQTEMSARGRALLECLLEPAHPQVPVLITQADAEQPQIFAALRELRRLGEAVPAHVHFLDRLAIDRPASRQYTERRMVQLGAWLQTLGAKPCDMSVHLAKQADLLDQLAVLRREARISGTDALQVIGAAAVMPVEEHLAALQVLIADLIDAPVMPGRRIVLAGSAQEGHEISAAVEAEGVVIIADTHGWGNAWVRGASVPRVTDSAAHALAVAKAAQGCEAVIHVSLNGDEAAPWDVARLAPEPPLLALRCGLIPDAGFTEQLRAFLEGRSAELALPQADATTALRPSKPPPQQSRSRKSLASVASVNAWQREWFAALREQVSAGSPFAVVNANAPQEILRALDIPFVVNQWWASIVAAKQQSRRYLGLLKAHSYPTDVEAYSAQGLAAAFELDSENAPWGGLPRPGFLHAVASSDATLKLFHHWAEETGAAPYIYERSIDPRPDLFADWWARLPEHWDTALEAERIDLMTAELAEVIASLEQATGRTFTQERFVRVMDLVNEQERYYRQTRDLIARTIPAPIGIVDSMPATMVPQWHRGSEWARDAAKAFYEEVKDRVEQGLSAVPHERIRLMFVGRGLWSEMGFYQKWEESHGAVFVWSMYLALAADGYIRDFSGGRDPLRALASRMIVMGDELRMPTWAGPWYVHEAETHAVDAVVALQDADPFVVRALRAAGYPVLELNMDNFNREGSDGGSIDAQVTAFIEGPASARAEARRNASNDRA